jgi:hypothetical protein
MANSTLAFGLEPICYMDGRPYNGAVRAYRALSTYAVDLFEYDPVICVGDANSTIVHGHGIGTLKTVQIATGGTTNIITGVIVGFEAVSGADTPAYGKASTDRIVLVADDPDLLFRVKDDGGAVLTYAAVGANACLVAGTGSSVTGRSGWSLAAATTPTTTQAYQLHVMAQDERPDNTPGAIYQNWIVRINTHQYMGGAAGLITGI